MMPQLRVRTEYSFGEAFGKIPAVAERLEEIGCAYAACVDTGGTWGHVRWQKELSSKGISPGFGAEIKITMPEGGKLPCWVLASDTREFYKFMSSAPTTFADMAERPGVLRFAGYALTDPALFDYVDINPDSVTAALAGVALAERTGKPLVLTGSNGHPGPKDEDHYKAWARNNKTTPAQILAHSDWRKAFWFLDDGTFATAVANTIAVAERIGKLTLPTAPLIDVPGDLAGLVDAGKSYRLEKGHIAGWTAEYQSRLERELAMIKQKAFESYFIVVADLVQWAKERMLVGPARGSSAGSLVCYLLRITEVDPLPSELLFERFIDINRDDLPDIDIDFNDQKRELVFKYLAEKYGDANVARIGSINTLKPRSVMAHVGKRLGIPAPATFAVLNVLIEYSSGDSRYGKGLEDTLTNTGPGQEFRRRFPEAELMNELENHASHTGVHAAGVIVSNLPVTEYCTVLNGVAQLDKKDAEELNLLKIDALGLRTLGVIEETGCITPEQLYGLKLDDPAVLRIFNEQKFSGLFQFEGAAQRRVSQQVDVCDFKRIDHVTALARPGPLGGGATGHYIQRAAGREPITYKHPSMAVYLEETMGVVLYQEQVMRIVRELGQFTWEETSVIRKAMSGRKGKEFFDQRGEVFAKGCATQGIPLEQANEIWNEICSFGAWGMNKSHTTSYAVISYWCAYMKCYHALEYAAACLRNAKDDEQTIEILRELRDEGVSYVPFDAELSEASWSVKEGKLIGGFTNLHGVGPVGAAGFLERRANGGLTKKDLTKLAKCKVKADDLSPAHTLYGDYYKNPSEYNINGRVGEFAELDDGENAVLICRLVRKERRDENETVRLARRNGVRKEGNSLFLDMFVVDDSVSKPVVARVKSADWELIGRKIADGAVDGHDWFLVRGRWMKQFSLLSVKKIKCLTNSELTA